MLKWALLAATALGCSIALPVDASAQTAQTTSTLEEVIVTARRSEERLQDVPIAITAFSAESLASTGTRDPRALANQAPSLTINPNNLANNSYLNVAIRGQGQLFALPGQGVVTYFAEVPTLAPGGSLFYDLRNVQVLKGPQGTLFGRNTTGGAVLFEPNRPGMEFDAGLTLRVGNYNMREGEGFVNLPIVKDQLALRVAANFGMRDGYTKNLLYGRRQDDENFGTVRAGLLYRGERFENYLVASYYSESTNGTSSKLAGADCTFAPYLCATSTQLTAFGFPQPLYPLGPGQTILSQAQALSPRETVASVNAENQIKVTTVTNISTLDVSENIKLKNIFGYRRNKTHNTSDSDGTALQLIDLSGLGQTVDQKDISDELQVTYTTDRFNLISGVFYYDSKAQSPRDGKTFANEAVQFFNDFLQMSDFDTSNFSAFAQGEFKVTDKLKLTAGYRYSWDKVTSYASNQLVTPVGVLCLAVGLPITTPSSACLVTRKAKFSAPTWTTGVSYNFTPDVMAYLNYRRGYRAGGINGYPAPGYPSAYAPEKVDDFELGLKSQFSIGDMPARVNVDLFHDKFKQLQRGFAITVVDAGQPHFLVITLNAAAATVKGVEFEGEIRPVQGLSLSGFFSYIDASYQKYVSPILGDISDTPFSYVPKWKGGVTARYTTGVGELGEFGAVVNWTHSGSVYVSNTPPEPRLAFGYLGDAIARIPAASLVNARLELNKIRGGGVDVAVFANNLFDKTFRDYTANGVYPAGGFSLTHYNPPRMYGVEVTAHF